MANKITVLIADDIDEHREVARLMLHAEGYEVIEAKDYETTIAAVEGGKVDVLLCDLMMPGNGVSVLEKLNDIAPDLPRVVVSARRRPPGLEHNIYVLKPYRLKDLTWAIDMVLHNEDSK